MRTVKRTTKTTNAKTTKKKEQEKKTSFIRLTRLDGSPIWLNVSFVVTLEPRKGGGSVVVPIGDGLDYDVREQPETVLAYLDGAPAPEVVPVPTSDALTRTPDDVSPEAEDAGASGEKSPEDNQKKKLPRKPVPRKPESADEKPPEPKFEQPVPPAAAALLDDEVVRLRKMAPRTVRKLHNTLMTQFKSVNAEAALDALVARGVLTIDGTRVNWMQPDMPVAVSAGPAPASATAEDGQANHG